MNMKLRLTSGDHSFRQESKADLKEVIINEDILHPGHESISFYALGENPCPESLI